MIRTFLVLTVALLSIFIPGNVLAVENDQIIADNHSQQTGGDYSNHTGIVWLDSNIGYFSYWSGSVSTDRCQSTSSPCKIFIQKTTDAGISWQTPIEVWSQSYLTNSPNLAGPAVWLDKWTPGDTGTVIHLAWVNRAFQTTQAYYRPYITSCDCFSIAAQTVGSSSLSSQSPTPATTQLSIVKGRDGVLYYQTQALTSVTLTVFATSTNGTSWTNRSQSGMGFGPIVYGLDAATDVIYQFTKGTSTADVGFRTYTLSSNTWVTVTTFVGANSTASTINSGYPISVTGCDDAIYVSAFGSEGTLNGRIHEEIFRIQSSITYAALGDIWSTPSNRFYGVPGRLFCDRHLNTLYIGYMYKPAATDSTSFGDPDLYPWRVIYRKKVVPFGGWSVEFTANNESGSPSYPPFGSLTTGEPVKLTFTRNADETARFAPVWTHRLTDGATVEHRQIMNNIAALLTVIPETPSTSSDLASNLRNMLSWIGIDDVYGYLGFAAVTTLALMVILYFTGAPFFLNGIVSFIWFSSVLVVLVTSFAWLAFWLFAVILVIGVFVVIKMMSGSGRVEA